MREPHEMKEVMGKQKRGLAKDTFVTSQCSAFRQGIPLISGNAESYILRLFQTLVREVASFPIH